jgi:hypothetical protein
MRKAKGKGQKAKEKTVLTFALRFLASQHARGIAPVGLLALRLSP